MTQQEVIYIEVTEKAAEKFLDKQMKNLKRVLVDREKLSSVRDIVIYYVQETATY